MPTTEAKLNRNRCLKSAECPLCNHVLATVPLDAEADTFYLACAHCHWSSRASGWTGTTAELAARLEAANAGTERGGERVKALIEANKRLASEEARATELRRQNAGVAAALGRRQQQRFQRYAAYRRPGQSFTYAECVAQYRSRRGKVFDEARGEWVDAPDTQAARALASVPTASPAALSADIFSNPPELYEVADLGQRFGNLDTQPRLVRDLTPMPRALLAKLSKRCKDCQHNMIKPELSPVSIKYKMKFFALLSVPEVRIVSLPEGGLKAGEAGDVVVAIVNPLDHEIDVTLNKKLPLPPSLRQQEKKKGGSEDSKSDSAIAATTPGASASSTPSLSSTSTVSLRVPAASAGERPRDEEDLYPRPFAGNATVSVPPASVRLGEHDPMQMFGLGDDDKKKKEAGEGADGSAKDENEFIVSSRGNTVKLKLPVTPSDVLASKDGQSGGGGGGGGGGNDVCLPLTLSFITSVSRGPTAKKDAASEPVRHDVNVAVLLKLGAVSA